MIVRIMGEGQLHVDDAIVAELNALDARLTAACEKGDEEGFRAALQALIARVRSGGSTVPADHLGESDLILPNADATMDDVREMLGEEGLIKG